MSKRFAVLTSTWGSEYTKHIISGIMERVGDDDIELHIFNAYDSGKETDYFSKGREIYALPDPECYDGMIVSLSTVGSAKYAGDITAKFHDRGKPVIGLDTHIENALFCGLDNYSSMYKLVDHMITIHDCRTLNYLGGPEDNPENMERYRAFCDCLASHGINVQKRRVLHKRYWKADGSIAYNEWKETGVDMTDAVICANDYMALGYVQEAIKDGISVPDYLKVTGFDNIDEAQTYSPSITSVNRNWKQLGFDSMDMLLEAVNGNMEFDTRFVQGYISYNESCGCDLTREIREDYNEVVKDTRKVLGVDLKHSYARQELFKCHSADEYVNTLVSCRELLEFEDAAVCINGSFFEGKPDMHRTGYDDKMIMYSEDGREEICPKKTGFPEKWREKERVFIFSSLRNSYQTYGYLVMPYRSDLFARFKHRKFIESLSLSLENLNLRIALKKQQNCLEK